MNSRQHFSKFHLPGCERHSASQQHKQAREVDEQDTNQELLGRRIILRAIQEDDRPLRERVDSKVKG